MENTDVSVQKEESTPIVELAKEDTPKINGEQAITEDTPKKINGEQTITEETSSKSIEETASVETKEDEVIPPRKSTEQENVTDTNMAVPPTCVSPGRANVPLKEVNESEKEESSAVITNGTENNISKKRELEQEDEQPEETTNDNDEKTSDQTKKLRITEANDTPIIETKESEKNMIVNGNTAVEIGINKRQIE
ncbi:unnamed protein product [Adineta steineri]|uniref:Uncharacterized protein n=1 Tax=Adineta steineri TaxID=433720 RepID=A0A818JQF4_9BILA|nr:unnamed protein product [Adineta steineri]